MMAISAVLATVGAFAIPLAVASAAGASAAAFKKKDNAKERSKQKAKTARIQALDQKQAAVSGKAAVGQGGSGSLLTGAGGLSDPALTGKQTLLAAQ